MIALTTVSLTLLFGVGLAWAWRRERDLFAPGVAISGLHFVRTIPYLALLTVNPQILHPLTARNLTDMPAAVAWYGVMEAIGYLCLMAMTMRPLAPLVHRAAPATSFRDTPRRLGAATAIALAIGLAAFALYCALNGGHNYMLFHLDQRVAFTSGKGYLLAAVQLLHLAPFLILIRRRARPSLAMWVGVCAALLLAGYCITVGTGGRKHLLFSILALFAAWHYGVRPIRRLRAAHALVFILLAGFFVSVPLFRKLNAVEQYAKDPPRLAVDLVRNSQALVTQTSYVYIYVYICDAFPPGERWGGRTFLDLATAWAPRAFYEDKPALSAGRYVFAKAMGADVRPGMPADELFTVDWPPETLGVGYMNFGVAGVMVGFLLHGLVLQLAYSWMRKSGVTAFSLYIYLTILFSFSVSNLRIAQCGATAASVALVFGAAYFFDRSHSLTTNGAAPSTPNRT